MKKEVKYSGKSGNLPPKIMSYEDRFTFNKYLRSKVREIGLIVADVNGVNLLTVCQKTRKSGTVLTRQIIHKIARDFTNAPLWLIADEIGGQDHASCMHSIKVINNYIDSKNNFVIKIYEDSVRAVQGNRFSISVPNPILDPVFIHNIEHCPQL
jgi:hypothetical protein